MTRPPYTVNPAAWDRAQRTAADPARDGCAIEHYPAPKSETNLSDWAIYLLAALFMALWGTGQLGA